MLADYDPLHDSPARPALASPAAGAQESISTPLDDRRRSLAPTSPLGGTQVVKSRTEADALVRQLKRLEHENLQFSISLTQMCDDNARLTDCLTAKQEQLTQLSRAPLSDTSVLAKLFDKDQHSSWLSGGKSATKEKLQHTLQDLQNEFIAYRESHTVSNDEMQSLVQELHAAHEHSSGLAKMLADMQRQAAHRADTGGVAPTFRVLIEEADHDPAEVARLKEHNASLLQQLETRDAAVATLTAQVVEANAAVAAAREQAVLGSSEVSRLDNELRESHRLRSVLEERIAELQWQLGHAATGTAAATATLTTEVQELQSDRTRLSEENAALEHELSTTRDTLEVRLHMLEQVHHDVVLQKESEVADLKAQLKQWEDAARVAEERNNARLRDVTASMEARLHAERETHMADIRQLQERLVAAQESIAEYESQLNRSVSLQNFLLLETRCNALQDEVLLLKQQQQQHVSRDSAGRDDAMDTKVERITPTGSTAEVDAGSSSAATALVVPVTAPTAADADTALKQRSELLFKKCTALTQEKLALEKRVEGLEEDMQEKSEECAALKQRLERLSDSVAASQQRSEQENAHSVESERNKRVAAEAAVADLQRQLADAQRARERVVQDDVRSLQEEITRLKGKCAELQATAQARSDALATSEEHLAAARRVSEALQQQMNDMQYGITQMATELERERTAHREEKERLTQTAATHAQRVALLERELTIHKNSAEEARSTTDSLQPQLQSLQAALCESEKQFARQHETFLAERSELERKHAAELAAAINATAAATAASSSAAAAKRARSSSESATPLDPTTTKEYLDLYAKYRDALETKVRNEQQLQKRIAQLEVQLETTVREAEDKLRQRVKAYETELDQCQRRIASMRADLDAAAHGNEKGGEGSGATDDADADSTASAGAGSTKSAEVRKLKRALKHDYVSSSKYYAIKCDNDKLLEDLKRQASHFRAREEELKLEIVQLQKQIKAVTAAAAASSSSNSGGGTDGGGAGSSMVNALRAANEALLLEKEATLAKLGAMEQEVARLRAAAVVPSTQSATPPTASQTLYAVDGAVRELEALRSKNKLLAVELAEVKAALEEKVRLNTDAAKIYHSTLDSYESEIKQLKRLVDNAGQGTSLDVNAPTTAAAPGGSSGTAVPGEPSSAAAKAIKRRKTSVKSKTPSAAGATSSLLGDLAEEDTVPVAERNDVPHSGLVSAHEGAVAAEKELAVVRGEVVTLKQKMDTLIGELRVAHEQADALRRAHSEELDRLREELVEQGNLREEAEEKARAAEARAAEMSKVAAVAPTQALSQSTEDVHQLHVQLDGALEEAKILAEENTELQRRLRDAETQVQELRKASSTSANESRLSRRDDAAAASGTGSSAALQRQVKQLEEQLRERDKADAEMMRLTQSAASEMDTRVRQKAKEVDVLRQELTRVASELVLAKQRLVELESFVDRLGVSWPLQVDSDIDVATRRMVALRLSRARGTPSSGAAPTPAVTSSRSPVHVGTRAADAKAEEPSPPPLPKARTKSSRARELPK